MARPESIAMARQRFRKVRIGQSFLVHEILPEAVDEVTDRRAPCRQR